jgi:hypothetical protein
MSTASIDELERSVTLASGQTWTLDSSKEALDFAHRVAPQYAVDATIMDWCACDPNNWLAVADLRWRKGYGDYADIPGYDHLNIGLAGEGDGPVLTYGDHRCTDLTRPFQSAAADRGGLARRSGFVLGVADDAEILHKGAPNMRAPYFVESWRLKTEGESIWIQIFWMFNAASSLHGGHVLWQLFLNQWSELNEAGGVSVDEIQAADVVHPGRFRYVHQGDWEGLSVVTRGDTPLGVHFRTHHDGDWLPWVEARPGPDWGTYADRARPLAQMASLSHASYPPNALTSEDDLLPTPGPAVIIPTVSTLQRADAHDWYGFAGAWGQPPLPDYMDKTIDGINPADETTGPLGPCLPRAAIELERVWAAAEAGGVT